MCRQAYNRSVLCHLDLLSHSSDVQTDIRGCILSDHQPDTGSDSLGKSLFCNPYLVEPNRQCEKPIPASLVRWGGAGHSRIKALCGNRGRENCCSRRVRNESGHVGGHLRRRESRTHATENQYQDPELKLPAFTGELGGVNVPSKFNCPQTGNFCRVTHHFLSTGRVIFRIEEVYIIDGSEVESDLVMDNSGRDLTGKSGRPGWLTEAAFRR